MKISVTNRQKDVRISTPSVKRAFIEAASLYNLEFDEAGVHFVTEKRICELHDQFFDDPSPTDCITCPIDMDDVPGYKYLGDVFVCPKAAFDHVPAEDKALHEEVTLYVIHGLLHLLGYDDMNESDQKIMRQEEARIMAHLKSKNLLIQ